MTRLSTPSIVLFACLFASQAALLVLSPLLPQIAAELGVSVPAAGQLRTISGATGGVTAALLAVAPRRPGLRALLEAGAGLVLAGSLLSAAAPAFAVLAVAQGVVGVGLGLLVAIGIAAAGEWPEPHDRPRTLAWAIVGMPMAWVAGMPLVGLASAVDWRLAFVAVPAASALAALLLVRARPADAGSRRASGAAAAWRRPQVARFALGELLANAAWASVLTYCGALVIGSYGSSRAEVAGGLAVMAAAMLPGTFLPRRRALPTSMAALVALTLAQGALILLLATVRPAAPFTFGLLGVMAFNNGWRSFLASSLGMDSAPDDKIAVMALRAGSNQFGYLLGAAAGGGAIALGGFDALGATLAAMFVLGALVHAANAVASGTLSPAWRRPRHRPSTPAGAALASSARAG